MVEEILFVLESFRTAYIFQKEMGKSCGDHVSFLGCQFNFGLGAIVNDENRADI
jgi:hypothetical protein